ncbi:hypothetical protein NUU61_000168 [Penicillium alfredii]|uniref:Uncharacterized protein n=1 Tax=Penicillium alfredii TaxID=1506179 RepID=A0A9W9G9H0_9EURO|nr:uncharacterized protein NUU61_000168 [Penicillium alfredii]KAJ5114409.1 hypothetical protein NUU61_000168 [Penicillium alfredii]
MENHHTQPIELFAPTEFLAPTTREMYEFQQEVVQELQKLGCLWAEAIARINYVWGDADPAEEYYEIVYHEFPEYWAHGMYYEGYAPYWEEHVDRSTWEVKEAPPRDSVCWTVKDSESQIGQSVDVLKAPFEE